MKFYFVEFLCFFYVPMNTVMHNSAFIYYKNKGE